MKTALGTDSKIIGTTLSPRVLSKTIPWEEKVNMCSPKTLSDKWFQTEGASIKLHRAPGVIACYCSMGFKVHRLLEAIIEMDKC